MERVNKLLDAFTRVLDLVAQHLERDLAEKGGSAAATPTQAAPRPRTRAKAPAPPLTPAPVTAASPAEGIFKDLPSGDGPAPQTTTQNGKPTAEEAVEMQRRCIETMGAFIKRHLNAKPSGLERMKKIVGEVLGHQIKSLDELKYEDHVKLLPRFEKELEAAPVA